MDSFLGISQPRMFVLDYSESELVAKKLHDVNFDDWSNDCFSWNRCIRSGSWGSPRKCILAAYWCEISKTIVCVRNGLVSHTSFFHVPERCEFENFRTLTRFERDSKF